MSTKAVPGISKTSLYGILLVVAAVVAFAIHGVSTGQWLDGLGQLAVAVAAAFGLKAAAPKDPA